MVSKTDPKRGPGRPSLDVWPVKVTLRLEDLQTARSLGDGEASKGLRRALQISKDVAGRQPAWERMEITAQIVWKRGLDTDHPTDWEGVSDVMHGIALISDDDEVWKAATFLSYLADTRAEIATWK